MDLFAQDYKIGHPIRLIELFAGIGAQAMALRDIGADFEHWRVVELDKYAVASYNAIHGTNFEPMDIWDVHGSDLGITDLDRYCYVLTYSFPCQSLSLAGKREGMERGSGTRSSLLWEVERILQELNDEQHLRQVLLMENVTQVHGERNKDSFLEFVRFLSDIGYTSRWQDLNSKDYGIPQSRDRCFMVSMLGDYDYEFPDKVELTKSMREYLEDEVDERFYINSPKAQQLIKELVENGGMDKEFGVIGGLSDNRWGERCYHQRDRVHSSKSCAVWDTAQASGGSNLYLVPVELSVANPRVIDIANCITTKDRGIKNFSGEGNGVAVPLNPMPDETCRCLKAQYYKTSLANFSKSIGLAATGVLVEDSGAGDA